MKKRLLSLGLVAAMSLSMFTACNDTSSSNNSSTTEQTEENNLGYLQGWSKYLSEKNNALVRAASLAEQAAELIMNEFEHQLADLQAVQDAELPDVPSIETDLEL